MNKLLGYTLQVLILSLSSCRGSAQEIIVTSGGRSEYAIVIPADATKLEQRSSALLQKYVAKVSGVELAIVSEKGRTAAPAIYLGNTAKADKVSPGKRKSESYLVHTDGKDIVICGGSGRGLIYGVYYFLETYLHCRKISNEPAVVPQTAKIVLPGRIHDERRPLFVYRECYYPAAHDAEYLEWNQLQQLDDLWGVWGHSFNKLVPAKTYFTTHPEYYSLVKGKRQPTQLCLTNEAVYKIVTNEFKTRMADNPDAIYWSVSPNDDNGYCECDNCKAINNAEGTPSGSLIKFVNRVAAAFPEKKITTLAYGYTHKAPKNIKPADNVFVFLSNIDAYRDKPLAEEGSAAGFRNDLKAWTALTPNIFIWDYVTQFTNYLAPFPNFHTLQPNMQYFKDNGVKGIFTQGSGDTYGEWAELRSYLIAKLYQDDKADVKKLTAAFIKDYYGNAAKYIQQYFDLVQEKMIASKRKLDIYGNPVNEWKTYLTPELIEEYSNLLDKAAGAVEGNARMSDRVMRARLPVDYTVLQQARFYGIEKHGIFVKEGQQWVVKAGFANKVSRFVANCKKAAVTELSEAGPARLPDEYLAEWNTIFKVGVLPSVAVGAAVTLQYPFAEDYPAKGNLTLTDGNPGYGDFSYNWLCFYGSPMVATIDLGKARSVSQVLVHLLDDPRHWIFTPENIKIEVSKDGSDYRTVGNTNIPVPQEHYETTQLKHAAKFNAEQARYIRVTATNLLSLPEWRYREGKKPMIACSEVFVQ